MACPPDSPEVVQLLELGPLTVQVIVPVGVVPGPDTVAVKAKVPPETTPDALSLTPVVVLALPTVAVMSEPELPT